MTRSSRGKRSREGQRRIAAEKGQQYPQPVPPVEPTTEPAEAAAVTR